MMGKGQVGQVQHGMEQKPKLRCTEQPLGAAAPLLPHEMSMNVLQNSCIVTLVVKQGGVNIPQEKLWEYWVPKSPRS